MNLTDTLLQALDEGAVIVTGNARAARALTLAHAERQRANGRAMWASPSIFDWEEWLAYLWRRKSTDPGTPLILTRLQEHAAWMRVQQEDASLVASPDGLASLAQGAWELLSGYQLHRERNSPWLTPDAEHFRQWAVQFEKLCKAGNWASRSDLPALLMRCIADDQVQLPGRILLAGFERLTPAQQSLLDTIRRAGASVDIAVTPMPEAPARTLVSATSASEEFSLCAEWCRKKLEENPEVRIGVIAPDVAGIRAEAERSFRAILMPRALDLSSEPAPMPFEFSLGVPLSSVPAICAALLMLHWLNQPIAEEEFSWLLLSGFFQSEASEVLRLAQVDFAQREHGGLSPEISTRTFIRHHYHAPFARRLSKALKEFDETIQSNRSYHDWTELAEQLLALAGWPGFRSPDSVQYQAQQRWSRLLDEVALLDFAGLRVSFDAFLQTLQRHASKTIFAPASHHVPIQVLGALESAGQTFDAIWFLGADDTQWPGASRPHSFLPIALQRRAKLPHGDPSADSELAIAVTRRIAGSAPECIFSYAQQNKEGELRPSAILTAAFGNGLQRLSSQAFRERLGIAPAPVEKPLAESAIVSSQIVPWPEEFAAGGAELLRDQGACPFRSFARRRLGAQELNRTDWGLDAAERGSLLHKVLEAIWSPDTPEPWRMVSLDDLKAIIAAGRLDDALRFHIHNAFANLVRRAADDTWMQAYLESEQRRLLVRLREWLLYEANRRPFTVERREERLKDVNVGGLKLNLRADRIDLLPDGSRLILDYKTSEVSASAWKGERPDEPQLPIYAVYGNVERVSGLLFAQIRAGKTYFVGHAADARQQIMVDLAANSPLVNQPLNQETHDAWQQALLQLAEEFLSGEASVDPKHGADTCTYCPLPGLCRVAEMNLVNETEDTEADHA